MLVRALVAGAVFALAVDHGTYGLTARHSLAIAVWWTLLLVVGVRLLPRAGGYGLALLPGIPLGLFALISLASTTWADSVERAALEFDRTALYLGVYLLVALAARRETLAQWTDGLAIGIAGIAILALVSRCFQALDLGSPIHGFLPGTEERLSFPLDYWNGLAILAAIGVPPILRVAADGRMPAAAAAAVLPFPALGATIYMTSSRGGVATTAIATIAFIAMARSWTAVAASGVAVVGLIAGVAVAVGHSQLVNEPLSSAARDEGPIAFTLVVAAGAFLTIAWYLALRFAPRPTMPRRAGLALAVSLLVVALAGAIAADPPARLEAFKEKPSEASVGRDEFVRAHLVSGAGSGRWQFWETAVDEFGEAPLNGHGAGSYEAWWAAHGTTTQVIRDAHSLYLETLGELGILGFMWLALFVLAVAVVAGRALTRGSPQGRDAVAAAAAAGLAYLCAAGIDWMWELTAVSVVGLACLALACAGTSGGIATQSGGARSTLVIRAALVVVALAMVVAEAVPLASEAKIRDSQSAAERGDADAAIAEARTARSIAPWASSPYLQLALVAEQANVLDAAYAHISEAIERDPTAWRLRIVAARIDARRGNVRAARDQLAEARRLNPRSPLVRIGQ
jgi:tetratricopeptide (TPR) repeat protein